MRTACRDTGRQILCNARKSLKLTAKIPKNLTEAGKLKAFATVCLADAFLVTGVRVVACEKGITVFMPSMKDKEDEYRDVCFPIKPELRSQIKAEHQNYRSDRSEIVTDAHRAE